MDDCVPFSTDSPKTGKPGCTVSSEKQKKDSDGDFKLMPISFAPDSFDIASIARGNANGTSKNWEYMGNLANDGDAAVKYSGAINANGVDNVRASNFTAGCAATDVKIYMDYNTTSTTAVMKGALVGADGSVTPQDVNGTIAKAFTISKDRFADIDVGAANIDMRYNITKLYNASMNPVEVGFKKLFAQGTDINATKDGVDTYQPTGEKTLGDQIAFIYGAIYSDLMNATEKIGGLTRDIVLSVVGYCKGVDVNCSRYKVNGEFEIFSNYNDADNKYSNINLGWYNMYNHTPGSASIASDGTISGLASDGGASATIKMKNGGSIPKPLRFDETSPKVVPINTPFTRSTQVIELGYPVSGRDKLVTYTITTDSWLAHKIATTGTGINPLFQINWINPGFIWTGKGGKEVGSVAKIIPHSNTKKVSW